MSIYRTFLFAPGSDFRKAEKAFHCGADAVILDLEDAVAVNEKIGARTIVKKAMNIPRECKGYVRINSLSTGFAFADLEEIIDNNIDGIMLPKVETATDILQVNWLLSELEVKRGIVPQKIDLLPLIETAKGLWNIESILKASNRVKRLAFGSGDFTLDIGSDWTKEGNEVLYARSRLVIASRVADIEQPIDAVFPDIRDEKGLIRDAKLGRQMGFQGKLVIHPKQVAPVNKIYSPTDDEIKYAEKVIAAFEKAEKEGKGAIQIKGKLIDYPVVEMAKKVLNRANAILDKSIGDKNV